MDDKLQEKFALVQQMRREKELKEAKAKESQPFDIFAIAGVTLPTGGSGGLNMTIRHDSQSASGSGAAVGSVKRPRKERTSSTNSTNDDLGESSRQGQAPVGGDEGSSGQKPKLKRSSMAARNEPQDFTSRSDAPDTDTTMASGSQRQPPNTTDSTGQEKTQSPNSVTPPTPIPSPPNNTSSSRRNSGSSSPTKLLAKDMTHNVQSRSGSIDENEEMVIDMFGRSVPRSRHHSSDEGSESESDMAHPRRRRRTRLEEEEMDRYRPSYQRSGRYGSRSRSRSRSRSMSPGRRHHRRSRSRSVSPYYPHARDNDRRRRGGGRRGGDREGRDRYSGDEVPPRTPAEEVDPYQAASRYLDTAFYPTKIYVGNLPSSISLTSLRTLFAPFGDIEDMNLVEGKDFGFVTYVEPAGAQQALAKMNGAMLDGTYIRVNRAKIPERNRRGFAGVAWMDEDGELARLEEEQHQQAAAIAGGLLATGPTPFSPSHSRSESSSSSHHHQNHRDDRHRSSGGGGMASADRSGYPHGSSNSSRAVSPAPARPSHQLPTRPRSPKLPPKPTGAASFPPVGMDPRAAMVGRGGGRQILRYDDL